MRIRVIETRFSQLRMFARMRGVDVLTASAFQITMDGEAMRYSPEMVVISKVLCPSDTPYGQLLDKPITLNLLQKVRGMKIGEYILLGLCIKYHYKYEAYNKKTDEVKYK